MVVYYIQMYFILTQDLGDLLRRLQVNRSKFIGMRVKQILITTQIHIFWNEHMVAIIYTRIVHGLTFLSRVF